MLVVDGKSVFIKMQLSVPIASFNTDFYEIRKSRIINHTLINADYSLESVSIFSLQIKLLFC